MFKLFFILFYLLHLAFSVEQEDIRCTEDSCKDATCNSLPTKCNSSIPDSGTFLLSPDVCNCCQYCLINLELNEACNVGDPSNGQHTSICGPGLTCIQNNNKTSDGTCQNLITNCTALQVDFDQRKNAGNIGEMEVRAKCDEDGLFNSYKCIPGEICYCMRSNGSRIFGQADFNSISNYMPCGCSRAYYDAVDILGRELHPNEHFRCLANGNYDQLQCINDKCLCVDTEDGAPTYSTDNLINITEISRDNLPCYKSKTPGRYYKACEAEYIDIIEAVESLKEEGYDLVFGYPYPKCDLDGTYAPVQENQTHKYCVDTNGKILLILDKLDVDQQSLVESMNCNCVRANLITTSSDKPTCLANGNYNPIQCRRGICRCVDLDGNQVCPSNGDLCEYEDREVDKLHCLNKNQTHMYN